MWRQKKQLTRTSKRHKAKPEYRIMMALGQGYDYELGKKIFIALGVEQAALHKIYFIPIIVIALIQYHSSTSYLPPLGLAQKKYVFNGIKAKSFRFWQQQRAK